VPRVYSEPDSADAAAFGASGREGTVAVGSNSKTSKRSVSLGRYFNAACYIVSGAVVVGTPAGRSDTVILLLGILALLYGLYVALTRRTYWVSSFTYIVPVVLICIAIFGGH
jgi:hypothetical protein